MWGGKRIAVLAVLAATAVTALGFLGIRSNRPAEAARALAGVAVLKDVQGRTVGTVRLLPRRGGAVTVSIRARRLAPGFHAMHIHAVGRCEASAKDPSGATVPFFTAGGHHHKGTQTHGDHAGDLPTLLVLRNGTAVLTVVTDRFRIRDLVAGDGSAVIVHALRDNQANIPPRYSHPPDATGTTGPDDMTRMTGDAGGRVACGRVVLRR